jgi:hypothetical protein
MRWCNVGFAYWAAVNEILTLMILSTVKVGSATQHLSMEVVPIQIHPGNKKLQDASGLNVSNYGEYREHAQYNPLEQR